MDVLSQMSSTAVAANTTSIFVPIMHFFTSALLLGSVAVQNVLARPYVADRPEARAVAVDDFIQTEAPFALEQLLCNIGADGCNSAGVKPGLVIASPSKQEPPYFYTWTRDSALVFKSVVDRFVDSYDATLQRHITEYIASQAQIQGLSNPSGNLGDGRGLGEPKFNVDGTAFTDSWGRPQRDGPALRAIAIITYGNWLIDNGYTSTAADILWPIVRNDLEYVAQYWNQTGFDLWEEVQGSSFFTVASQHKALVEGAAFAGKIGKSGSSYASISPSILCFLQKFWLPERGFIDANINGNDGRTGLDANTVLASIHTLDTSLGCDGNTFQPCSDKALSNLKALVDSFRFYNINKNIPVGTAIAIGRYAEDSYYGGNPWYLNTLAVAEQLYDAIYVWREQGSITVTSTSQSFFAELVSGVSAGTYQSGSTTYNNIINAVSAYADGFVGVVATYAKANGSLDEQFSKDNGSPLSAKDLTWSYAAFLTAVARREGTVPPPWAGGSAPAVPGTCSAPTIQGSYASATATSFPPNQTPIEGGPPPPSTTTRPPTTTTSQPAQPTTTCAIAPKVTVTFEVRIATTFGQTIKIVGADAALGGWDTSKAITLSASDYTTSNPVWKGSVVLSSGQAVEYKYINVQQNGNIVWEKDPNRAYTVPKTCAATATKSDTWQS